MMNRRQFCATASAAILAHSPRAFAATYDIVIKGGRVIDPSVGIEATRDVAIVQGKIAAVEANITADATETIDARGKLVVPGLIDIHTHAGRSKEGPLMCLQDGVTGWVDAGSGGADNMDAIAAVARGAPQIGRCLINIARTGVAASCTTSAVQMWTSRAAPLHAIATSSLVSRDACRTTLPAPTIWRRYGARRRRPTVCRS